MSKSEIEIAKELEQQGLVTLEGTYGKINSKGISKAWKVMFVRLTPEERLLVQMAYFDSFVNTDDKQELYNLDVFVEG